MSSAALQLADDLETLPLATSAKRQQCVLLIEDNEDSMFLVKYALQEYGEGAFHLNWANCLSTGLEQLLNGGVDIVLLDLGLPESSGPESYAWVREVAPKTPVVVLTGDSRDQTELATWPVVWRATLSKMKFRALICWRSSERHC